MALERVTAGPGLTGNSTCGYISAKPSYVKSIARGGYWGDLAQDQGCKERLRTYGSGAAVDRRPIYYNDRVHEFATVDSRSRSSPLPSAGARRSAVTITRPSAAVHRRISASPPIDTATSIDETFATVRKQGKAG